MTEWAIDVKHLTKKFAGRTVVNNISIKVPKGKIYGFLGPNGSGKTTTIRMLCGLLTPDSGEGTCLGCDIIAQTDLIRAKVGYMTQKFSFWEDLSIKENLEFVAGIYGLPDIAAAVAEALDKLGLSTRADQLAGSLSGGWKQRLALAACILHHPDILLLDEPTAGVDPKARREFWDEINRLSKEGLTVLVSTHYMDEAERCHEIVYIAYGNIMVQGSVAHVIQSTNLSTFTVSGADMPELRQRWRHQPEIVTMAQFGENLHICGRDKDKLATLLSQAQQTLNLTYAPSATTLEDAFIYYLNQAVEN